MSLRSRRRPTHRSTRPSFRQAKSSLWSGRHSISAYPRPSERASSGRTTSYVLAKVMITTGSWTVRQVVSCARHASSIRRAAARSRSAPPNPGSSFTRATSWTARLPGSVGGCTAIAPRSVSRRSISPIHRTTPTSRRRSCDPVRCTGVGPSSLLACFARPQAPSPQPLALHAATLRRGRQDGVEPQVIRFLAVVIRPVPHCDHDRGGAREGVGTEQLDRLVELRIVQVRERRLAELERLLEPCNEGVLAQGRVRRGTLRCRHAGDLAAEHVVPLVREVRL